MTYNHTEFRLIPLCPEWVLLNERILDSLFRKNNNKQMICYPPLDACINLILILFPETKFRQRPHFDSSLSNFLWTYPVFVYTVGNWPFLHIDVCIWLQSVRQYVGRFKYSLQLQVINLQAFMQRKRIINKTQVNLEHIYGESEFYVISLEFFLDLCTRKSLNKRMLSYHVIKKPLAINCFLLAN